jgi:outer membrane protein assembly factor BamE (lipoprotein component of BamABCDE complex)
MKKRTLVVVLCLLAFAACSSMGTKEITDPSKTSQIKIGQTSKSEVRSILGEPSMVNFNDKSEETWQYMYMRSQVRGTSFIPVAGAFIGGADIKQNSLTILFDSNGIVKNMGEGLMTGGGGSVRD